MRKEDFNILLKERINEIETKLIAKRSEYVTGEDVFGAFKKATGISFQDCPEKLAWEYLTKHLQSIKDIIEYVSVNGYNGYPEKELLREKFGDAINYMLLIELMIVERIRTYKP
jgi:hypothetical protein